jgi:hypothetical protein
MESGKDGSTLFFLGKYEVSYFEENFDLIYDKYKKIAIKKGLKGDLKFVNSLDIIYIYVAVL